MGQIWVEAPDDRVLILTDEVAPTHGGRHVTITINQGGAHVATLRGVRSEQGGMPTIYLPGGQLGALDQILRGPLDNLVMQVSSGEGHTPSAAADPFRVVEVVFRSDDLDEPSVKAGGESAIDGDSDLPSALLDALSEMEVGPSGSGLPVDLGFINELNPLMLPTSDAPPFLESWGVGAPVTTITTTTTTTTTITLTDHASDAPADDAPPGETSAEQVETILVVDLGGEALPEQDDMKIGVEIEGIGNLNITWSPESERPKVGSMSSAEFKAFIARLKRMKLIRSSDLTETRGVYLSPEEVSSRSSAGRNHPAELVSSPHPLNAEDLLALWKSVRTALFSASPPPGFWDRRTRFDNATLSTRWGKNRTFTQVAGSLQTTIGVSVAKLLGDDQAARDAVVDLLIAPGPEREHTKALLSAAVTGQQFLSQKHAPMASGGDPTKVQGLRLALFMSLIDQAVSSRAILVANWEKEALGAHFKGYSSFAACGLGQGDLWASAPATLRAGLIEEMTREGPDWLSVALASLRLADIGRPGLSMQVKYENAPAIPCFFNSEGELCTVVESRQKEAPLNQRMAALLNTKEEGNSKTAVRGFLADVGRIVGATTQATTSSNQATTSSSRTTTTSASRTTTTSASRTTTTSASRTTTGGVTRTSSTASTTGRTPPAGRGATTAPRGSSHVPSSGGGRAIGIPGGRSSGVSGPQGRGRGASRSSSLRGGPRGSKK
ncbi:hypothetical protein [Sorangium sp. So ce204]|uniref:hypothetical protein n=1 Tax=Sorangium sp. So ce204 TaxID=3133288 RepID=UPI003F5D9577